MDTVTHEQYGGKEISGKKFLFIFLAFLLLPATGLILFWFDAQSRIAGSAEPFLRAELPVILGEPNPQRLAELASFRLTPELQDSFWQQVNSQHGRLLKLEKVTTNHMNAGADDRDDMAWQFLDFRAEATFEKGSATVIGRVARRTTAPDWRIDAIQISR